MPAAGWRVVRPLLACVALAFCRTGAGAPPTQATQAARAAASATLPHPRLDPVFDDLEQRTFRFFWETANPANGLVPDRYPKPSFASIAAVGFALTAYPIGVERGYVSRAAARARVLATLRFFTGTANEHGFFYHYLDMRSGARANDSEISTVDTSLLLAGVLFCGGYFDGAGPEESEIRRLADGIYRRVDWTWAEARPPAVALAWNPETGFSRLDWHGYDEAMVVYLLALGSPTHAVSARAWRAWTSTYGPHWGTLYGQTHLSFAPLFGHQYTHVWVDFRGIRDAFMREHGLDYFENSRRATVAQRAYAIANPARWLAYGANVWGLTACDGPGKLRRLFRGELRRFYGYAARGVGVDRIVDDGTIAPTAAASSLPFAPEIVTPAVLELHRRFGASIYGEYGFRDSFNPSFGTRAERAPDPDSAGWVDPGYLGIDQGPIVAMIENYRSGLVWRVMRANPYLRRGLERAGFTGGWLAPPAP